MSTLDDIKSKAIEIRDATQPEAISANDVGGNMLAIANYLDDQSYLPDAVKDVENKTKDVSSSLINKEDDEIIIQDGKGNTVVTIDKNGVNVAGDLKKNGTPVVTDISGKQDKITAGEGIKIENNIISADGVTVEGITHGTTAEDDDVIVFVDANNNEIVRVTKDGLKVKNITDLYGNSFDNSDWKDKNYATYGDSVTEINSGDHTKPYSSSLVSSKWGVRIADYFGMASHHGRGIGGQHFRWGTNGGSLAWVTPTGSSINRTDDFNYDNFDGSSYPEGVTAEMEAAGSAIRVRGCGCSWRRIVKSFPSSIKSSINVVSIMFHNDAGAADTDIEWVANSTVDTEWASSNEYSQFGGDYNITSVNGAIASTIMKLQAWMPNAVLVLCTPISGRGNAGEKNKQLYDQDMESLAKIVKKVAFTMSIPCIDVYGTDGINGLNRTNYISDTIHPYLADGKKMVARAIIGGLKNIIPL